MGDDWISLNQKFCWWNTSLVARFEWIAAPFCWTFPMKLPISNPSMISDEKSDNFGLVESHKLAINPSLCQWLHMIGWLLVLLIGWLHIFIIIDSLLLMMSVFFNTTLHTILSPLYHPLNSTIFLEIFVVHGGLSRGAPGSFLRLLGKPTHGTHGERLAAGWYSVSEVPGGCGWFMFS